MRILFLTQVFPLPLDSGGKIKTYHTIRNLARKHEVRVVAYIRNENEISLVPELARICSGVETASMSRSKARQVYDLACSLGLNRSFIVSRDYRSAMQEAYNRAISNFKPDVIHIDHLQMAQFVDFKGPQKTVLDHHNVEHLIIKRIGKSSGSPFTRLYAGIEWPKLQKYELDVCRRCNAVLTVSEEDKRTLLDLDNSIANITAVPIGVDIEHFYPVNRKSGSVNILSVGTMYWPPNVDAMLYFAKEIFPKVLDRLPESTLTIAGQRPTAAIKALGEHTSIFVTGYVDDDRVIAKDCGVFIVPLRSGSGVRVKILNALAMGLPVVSTSVGAEGLDIKNEEHVLLADTPDEFADAVVRVLQDYELATRLGENGRKLVCEKYSWTAVGTQLLDTYNRIETSR